MRFSFKINTIFFLLLILSTINADSFKELFNDGVKQYEEKNYEAAAKKFEQVLEQGRSNGELLYNLGNCYFRLENTGKTILYYEKAKEYYANDPDLSYNLEIARSRIQNPIIVPPKLFFIKWWNFIISNISFQYAGYGLLLMTFLILLLSFLKVYYAEKRFVVMLQFIRKAAVVILLFFIVITGLKFQFLKNNEFAVVMSKKSPLKSEPFVESKNLIFAPEGTKVRVVRHVDEWKEIELPDGNKGWIKNEQVGEI